ncbi:MAG TPA: hypothetical protein VE783_10740 [Candidatus Limnocylindrales bacterium]|jgi:hypothetical protein|nr:hypothetical protein [Candidatus Limnocylindrales bacterium]
MHKLPLSNFLKLLMSFTVALGCAAHAQLAPAPSPSPAPQAIPPSISLSPAVVMAKGSFGQGLTQVLTLTNNTGMDLAFELQAQDIVVKDGKRTFATAGETPNSIAATAVFTPKSVLVKAHTTASAEVRLTIPAKTDLRAVSAIFMGTDKLQSSASNVAMTASLAALITFNLTDNAKLQQEPAHVLPASETANMTIRQWVANVGSEPVLPEGTAAVLNAKGNLMGKTTFPQQRLLPGERLEFSAEYPDQLQPGDYRALCSFQYEGKVLTNTAEFKVDAKP